jgi:hypothetical protein
MGMAVERYAARSFLPDRRSDRHSPERMQVRMYRFTCPVSP